LHSLTPLDLACPEGRKVFCPHPRLATQGAALSIAADRDSWLRALNQGSTYLGLAMIALVWLGLDFHLKAELATVQNAAIQNAGNLSRAFEEHLARTLKDADHTLQIARNAY
jgi:hypothetical protein